jgi:hypothetical protein
MDEATRDFCECQIAATVQTFSKGVSEGVADEQSDPLKILLPLLEKLAITVLGVCELGKDQMGCVLDALAESAQHVQKHGLAEEHLRPLLQRLVHSLIRQKRNAHYVESADGTGSDVLLVVPRNNTVQRYSTRYKQLLTKHELRRMVVRPQQSIQANLTPLVEELAREVLGVRALTTAEASCVYSAVNQFATDYVRWLPPAKNIANYLPPVLNQLVRRLEKGGVEEGDGTTEGGTGAGSKKKATKSILAEMPAELRERVAQRLAVCEVRAVAADKSRRS